MKIIGETAPFTGRDYQYKLVNHKNEKIAVSRWEVRLNDQILTTSKSGKIIFNMNLAMKTLKILAFTSNKTYTLSVSVVMGSPAIGWVEWQDIEGKPLKGRKVGYLDKVRLCIKTVNFLEGEKLTVTIYEDQFIDGHGISSITMGTYQTTGVNKNGKAYLLFNNMSVYRNALNSTDPRGSDEAEHEYYAKIVYNKIIDIIKDDVQLIVQNELKQYIKPNQTNTPVKVGDSKNIKKQHKKPINYTFGVFFDGTLNNMYNSEIRKSVAEKRRLSHNISYEEAKKIKEKKGKKDSSYENELSNPAILFKSYTNKDSDRLFKIYVEGIGTNTQSPTKAEDYKKDDNVQGPAFGMGSAGIIYRVREAIKKITGLIDIKEDEYINKITFDVFGFSRGAAAARHFVYVVTHPEYIPKTNSNRETLDIQGEILNPEYYKKAPRYGLLGILLDQKGWLTDNVKVEARFAGLYDTVSHHGLYQDNDIEDLGLDSINKANYVVHMVAADEHRYNFDLADISSVAKTSPDSGKKGGIELFFPGVHSDVGGSYVDGAPNISYKINFSSDMDFLTKEKEELIRQGWFSSQQISVKYYLTIHGLNNYRLEGIKNSVSNQYSYIPLHIMAEFGRKKGVQFNNNILYSSSKFTNNPDFLNKVKKILWDYSFNGGPRLVYKEKGTESENELIRKLRLYYLHWNSTYGTIDDSLGAFVTGKDKPNFKNSKRQRDVY